MKEVKKRTLTNLRNTTMTNARSLVTRAPHKPVSFVQAARAVAPSVAERGAVAWRRTGHAAAAPALERARLMANPPSAHARRSSRRSVP